MDYLLFSSRSIWTMVHGVVLGGGALVALAAALFSITALGSPTAADATTERQARYVMWLLIFSAAALWLTVLVGTYVNFPAYRATPPEGLSDLGQFPRSLIQSNPQTVWLHSFAMEIQEHVPWIAALLATAVAFVAARYRSQLLRDARIRRGAQLLLAICFMLVAAVSLLGVFINKVAPLE